MEEPSAGKPDKDLLAEAKAVLEMNDQGSFTIPAVGLYPHQWLWDSCFIAIGLRHYDIKRAQAEILRLLHGQWANGMIPHQLFSDSPSGRHDQHLWRSWVSPLAPNDVVTSGITQPPMLAEAIVLIGAKLKKPQRRTWYKKVFPALLKYHVWLYTERDPHQEGLVLQIHPYESGLDNTPPWVSELRQHHRPWWAVLISTLRLEPFLNLFRRDTRHLPDRQRMGLVDALLYFDVIRRFRRKLYKTEAILSHSLFTIEDLVFNSIFIRANHHLKNIATAIKQPLPEGLAQRMSQTEEALEKLWDDYTKQYYSRNFVTHGLIKEPSVASLMPLYAGSVTKERANELVELLVNEKVFASAFPIPTVPLNSPWFSPTHYWQGPVWLNINWLIIDGLKRYKFDTLAEAITRKSLELVSQHGFYEYFSPLDGSPAGVPNFSWTAALTIDLLKKS